MNFLVRSWLYDSGVTQISFTNHTRNPFLTDENGENTTERNPLWRPIINAGLNFDNEEDLRRLIIVEAFIEPRFPNSGGYVAYPFDEEQKLETSEERLLFRERWLRLAFPNLTDLEAQFYSIHALNYIEGERNELKCYIAYLNMEDWAIEKWEEKSSEFSALQDDDSINVIV